MDKCQKDADFMKQSQYVIEKEERQNLRKIIFDSVMGNVDQETERYLLNYKGFDIILPKKMTKEKPYVYVQRVGRYVTEIGDVEKGAIIRIDNCIDGLENRFIRLENAYNQLLVNNKNIEDELQKDENYDERILAMKAELQKIDKQLGVKNND